ncbi:SGNH/GDSL hydrolase family protein [Agromyces sp. MMS24-K17]|uniref:SGNH/GDSL hydrolase family protein n=1 Tax=Agromyces sp. MMS24-K17 TaxID=3372850 RepID=UPI003754FF82
MTLDSSARLAAGFRLAAATALGHAGVPRFRQLVVANAATLNETLPVHSKWWRDRAAAGGDLVHVTIGDSAAQGIGASHPSRGWSGRVSDAAAAVTGRVVHAVNLSVSGATTGLAVRDQLPRLAGLDPDLVTVSIGANDIAGWDPREFDDHLRTILDAVPEHAIVADLPCFHLFPNERRVAEANRLLRSAAAERDLEVVPLHEGTRRRGLRGILTEFADDLFHPNDDGYAVWAEAFGPAVARSLAARGLARVTPLPQRRAADSPDLLDERMPPAAAAAA